MILLRLQKTSNLSFNKTFVVSLLSADKLSCIHFKPTMHYFFNTTKKLFGQKNNPTNTQQ